MDGIYIIDDKLSKMVEVLDYPKIDFARQKNATDFHNYVVTLFQQYNIQKLIIPVRLTESTNGKFDGLTLGLHIRLTPEIGNKRFIPIIFIGDEDLEEIFLLTQNNPNHPAYLLTTNGCVYLSDVKAIKNFLSEDQGVADYEKEVLNPLKIESWEEEGGKHSLANIWGALRLNDVLNLNVIPERSDSYKKTKELYFKFLRAFHGENKGSYKDLMPLDCTNKRILLIDDEADNGWADVLKAIFKNGDFQSIDFKEKSFEVAYNEAIDRATKEDWDLILLDLRLNPAEEDKPNQMLSTEQYSGEKILKVIKKHNAGIQVIMLTASNKAWNMKKLLDLGADGYYIKESPEFNFSPSFTKESYHNLKDEVLRCFNAQYLKIAFNDKKLIENHLKSIVRAGGGKGLEALNKLKMINEITDIQLPQAFALMSLTKKDEKFFSFAFLSYFKVLEIINDYFIEFDNTNSVFRFKESGEILDYFDFKKGLSNRIQKSHWKTYEASTPIKLYNIMFRKLGFDIQKDSILRRQISQRNTDRNNFIHPPDGLKSTKIFSSSDCIEISDLVKTILLKLS